jgi:hypothetical protein
LYLQSLFPYSIKESRRNGERSVEDKGKVKWGQVKWWGQKRVRGLTLEN